MASQSPWTRRDVLRTFAAAATAPVLAGAAAPLRRVGIVGAGMAGVSLAWLLDESREIVILEAQPSIGGNVQSLDVELDGHSFVVDMGAQFFHPGPYPLYTALLTALGLYPPGSATPGPSHSFPASITVAADGETTPRFVSPVLPGRAWPALAPWNRLGLEAFFVGFAAARAREQRREGWALTLGDWLPTLGLSAAQWEGMLLPWAASLFSGSIEQARSLSARAAMIFAAKALPANLLDPLVYYVLTQGMAEVLQRLLDQCTTVQVLTGARVQHVSRLLPRGFQINCDDGRMITVDDLVFASSGPATLSLLSGIPGTEAQRIALAGVEFHDARLALHTDPLYASPHPALWSFLNCKVAGAFCEASMWLADVVTGPPRATTAKLWKSWTTHRQQQPARMLHEAAFKHMLPTPATLLAQSALRRMQGRDGIWLAGGYLHPYDAQETALWSAISVALGLGVTSARADTLLASAS